MDNFCCVDPSGLVVDGIKIVTKPARNFSEILFSDDDIFFKGMKLNKNISVLFDMGVILKSHNLDYTVRKDVAQMIQTLLKKDVPVYMCACSNLYSFCEIWNKQCYDENVDGSVKAIIIPETIGRWRNTDCIGVTDRLLLDTQMHFMYEGAGTPCAIVTGLGDVSNYPVKVKYSATFAGVIKVGD